MHAWPAILKTDQATASELFIRAYSGGINTSWCGPLTIYFTKDGGCGGSWCMTTYVIIWAWIKTVLVFRKNVLSLQYGCFQIRKIEHNGVSRSVLRKVGGLQISSVNCKSRKFTDSQNLLHLPTFRKKWRFAVPIYVFLRFTDLQSADPIFFWTLNFRKCIIFFLTHLDLNVLVQICTKVNKTKLWTKLLGCSYARALQSFICYSWIIDRRWTFPFTKKNKLLKIVGWLIMKICEFSFLADCTPKKLRICEMRINPNKFGDLRLADWLTKEICGFAIVESISPRMCE